MTLKNGFVKCWLFVLSANWWKDQNMDSSFSRKENPNMEKVLFDWPIVLQYDVKAKYRLISRKFACMKFFQPSVRLTNRKPRSFVSVRQTNQIALFPFVSCFCFVRAFLFQGHTKTAHTQVVHTHRTSCRIVLEQLVQRVWPGELNPSPHSWICFPSQWIPVLTPTYSLPLPFIHTSPTCGTKPIRDSPLSRSARCSFAPLQKSRRNDRLYV